jgi:hypothetical protein
MALVLLDRAGGTAYSPTEALGQGSLLIANDLTTYQELSNIGNGNTFYYLARHRTQDEWEVGVGTILISGAFTYVVRSAANVQDGSSGTGALVDFSAGYVDIISVFTAAAYTSLLADVSSLAAGVSIAGSTYVSVENTGTSQYAIYANIDAFDARYAQNTSVSVEVAALTAALVSTNAAITSVGADLFAFKTSINALTPVLQTSITANQDAVTSVGTALFLFQTSVNNLTPVLQTSITANQDAITSINAAATSTNTAITSINTALTSINTAATSTNTAVTSVGAAAASVGVVAAANTAAITSINAAVPRLAAGNAFTGTNSFAAPISASSANFFGSVRVSANAWTPLFQLTDGTSIPVDFGRSNKFYVTLGGNRTIEAPTNLQPGQGGVIWLVQDGTGGRTVAWNSVWKFPSSTAPTLSTTSAAIDAVAFEVYTSTRIAAQAVLNV